MAHPPPVFKASTEQALAFAEQEGFGLLCSTHNHHILSTPVPFIFGKDRSELYCHIARSNPQWQSLASATLQILGAHAYISPSVYETPGVPTWNYQTVSIQGRCSLIDDIEHKKAIIIETTRHFEAGRASPWDADFNENLLNAIVVIKMQISDVQGKFKLSQNRSLEDQKNVKADLAARGNPLHRVMNG